MALWAFLRDEKNQQTLRWIGGAITAAIASGWMLWQQLHTSSPEQVAQPAKSQSPIVATPSAPASGYFSTPPVTINPSVEQNAASGNGGVSVNASGNANIHVNQNNSR